MALALTHTIIIIVRSLPFSHRRRVLHALIASFMSSSHPSLRHRRRVLYLIVIAPVATSSRGHAARGVSRPEATSDLPPEAKIDLRPQASRDASDLRPQASRDASDLQPQAKSDLRTEVQSERLDKPMVDPPELADRVRDTDKEPYWIPGAFPTVFQNETGDPFNYVLKEPKLETWGPHILRSRGWWAQTHMAFM